MRLIENKKRMKVLVLVILMSIVMTGCQFNEEQVQKWIDGDVWEEDMPAEQEGVDETVSAQQLPERQVIDGIKRYAYDQLTEEEQKLYLEIYNVFDNMAEDITLSSKNPEDVDRIFQYVMDDHPEFFFVEGYSMSKYTTNDVLTSLSLSGKYTKTVEERENCQEQIDEYVNTCLADAPLNGTQYDLVKYIYDYLVTHTDYDLTAVDNQNICSVFIGGKSVCQGYAKATQYLLEQEGITCILVSGTVKNGESHAWNLADIDGNWCYIDTTWGDASYQMESTEVSYPQVNYDYLGVNQELLQQTHFLSSELTLPACTSLDEYYYVKEGCYFEETDSEKLQSLIQRYYEEGKETLTIKCASQETYDAFIKELIDQEKIFDYFINSGNVRYARMDDTLELLFYL